MPRADVPSARKHVLLALALGLAGSVAFAAEPKQLVTPLDSLAFFKPDLYISSSQQPLAEVMPQLANRGTWESFLAGDRAGWANPSELAVWIDPRSGAAVNIMGAYPLIPGDGFGNTVKAGAGVNAPTGAVQVEQALRRFLRQHAALLGIDVAQLGEARVTEIHSDLWQVYI